MQDQNLGRLHVYARFASAASMFAVAGALVYFTCELSDIADYLPGVIQSVDQTIEKIDPIMEEVSEIKALVPPLLDEVAEIRVMIPPILTEVENTREAIKPAIDEYAKTNEQLPRILDEYSATREMLPEMLPGLLKTADNISFAVVTVTREVGANRDLLPQVQKTADKTADALVILAEQAEASQPLLPDMLKTADNASNAVVVVSKEIEAIRPLLPQILAEVEKTREMVPPMMDRADRLVANARQAAKEAGEGATSGFFTGLLKAPFVFVGDVGKALVGSDKAASVLSESDFDKLEMATRDLLADGSEGDVRVWGLDEGRHGKVKLVAIRTINGQECRSLLLEIMDGKELISDRSRLLCKNDNGEWDFTE